jgi:hypothetical protein
LQRGRCLLGAGEGLLAVEGGHGPFFTSPRRRGEGGAVAVALTSSPQTRSARPHRSCSFASSASPCPRR